MPNWEPWAMAAGAGRGESTLAYLKWAPGLDAGYSSMGIYRGITGSAGELGT